MHYSVLMRISFGLETSVIQRQMDALLMTSDLEIYWQ